VWIRGLWLFRAPVGEDEPAIEHGSAPFAATAGPDSEGRGNALDGITETHIFVDKKSRQAHSVRLMFTLFCLNTSGIFLVHDIHLLLCAVTMN